MGLPVQVSALPSVAGTFAARRKTSGNSPCRLQTPDSKLKADSKRVPIATLSHLMHLNRHVSCVRPK
jgi:hypothetical protein